MFTSHGLKWAICKRGLLLNIYRYQLIYVQLILCTFMQNVHIRDDGHGSCSITGCVDAGWQSRGSGHSYSSLSGEQKKNHVTNKSISKTNF